jgi:4-hydroxybutyrate CoA-transferase
VDVGLIQVTPPDADGFCSYGVSVDYTQAVTESARIVIAQMNSELSRTGGAKVSLDQLTFIVEEDEPVLALQPPRIGEVERRIGEHAASLIPDGATVQLGIGATPDAVLLFLKDKKDLGIHSEMFSDGVVDLAELGVVTNRKKTIHPGKFVVSFLMGSRRMYDFANNNPAVELSPVDYVNDLYVIGQHDNMISVNSALQVDLMGQVNAEMIGARSSPASAARSISCAAPAAREAASRLSPRRPPRRAERSREFVVNWTRAQRSPLRGPTFTMS